MRGEKPQATGDEVEAMIQLLHWAQDPVHIDTLLDVRDLVQNRQLGNAKRAALHGTITPTRRAFSKESKK